MIRPLQRLLPFALLCLISSFGFAAAGLSQGCANACTTDQQCQNHLRCGPGQYCLLRCFQGETEACQSGFVCDKSGLQCVKAPNTDAAPPSESSAEARPEPPLDIPPTEPNSTP